MFRARGMPSGKSYKRCAIKSGIAGRTTKASMCRECAIGMRRLSIIDLGGHQPISNEDGSVWVVFNGEIYNFQELRRNLIARATVSDQERH